MKLLLRKGFQKLLCNFCWYPIRKKKNYSQGHTKMTESLGNVIFNLGSRMPRLKINQKHEKKYLNLKTKEENILMKDGKIREEKLENS